MSVLATAARQHTLVVVPGGGPFADAVRRADRRFHLDDSSSHWMAILAMDQYAYLLAALAPRARLVWSPSQLVAGRLNVVAASAWLRGADPLPHSWEVTSDSIAAWVARRLWANRLVLLKDVDGQFDRDPAKRSARLLRQVSRTQLLGVVDAHFARALGASLPCWIINGVRPNRIAALLRGLPVYGTQVV